MGEHSSLLGVAIRMPSTGVSGSLAAASPTDCRISPSILRGPSDVTAGGRGQNNFFRDRYDVPRLIGAVVARVNRLLINALDRQFRQFVAANWGPRV
jgi:hypothetical protein